MSTVTAPERAHTSNERACGGGEAAAFGVPRGSGACPASEAPLNSFAAQVPDPGLVGRINQLKTERDAVILAHYYVQPEVQAVADYIGDSFYLAKLAVDLPAKTIVLAGVEFMGESAKLLNPEKVVLLPEPKADCPMAHMVAKETIDDARARYGDDLAVVCYVNSTAQMKTWSDVCVTSSNAVKICREIPQSHLLFIPDVNLGRYIAKQVPEKHVILNKGFCPRHQRIVPEEIIALEEEYPEALVLAHPECTEEVLAEADYIGSTKGIIEFTEKSDAQDFIVVTMVGVLREMELRNAGSGKRFHFTRRVPVCENMTTVTLQKVAECLENDRSGVEVPEEYQAPARKTLELMLEYAAR